MEGPVFERDGNLVFSDVSGQRILRVDPDKKVSTVFHRDNIGVSGLAIDQTGRILIASIDISQAALARYSAFALTAATCAR